MVNVGKGTATEPNIGWSLFIVSVVMVIISGLFVVVRIAIRLSRRMMGMDDYMIILVRAALGHCPHTTANDLAGACRWLSDLSFYCLELQQSHEQRD